MQKEKYKMKKKYKIKEKYKTAVNTVVIQRKPIKEIRVL